MATCLHVWRKRNHKKLCNRCSFVSAMRKIAAIRGDKF